MKAFSGHPFIQKILALSLVLSAAILMMPAFSEDYQDYPVASSDGLQISQNLPPLQGRVVTAPAGTFMSATLQQSVSSEYARPGDRITATLGTDIAAGGSIVLPANSLLEGQVVSATNAGRAGRNGQLEVRFNSAVTPTGQRVPLSARIQTEDGTGILKGGTKAGRIGKAAGRAALGAGAGAALGTAMGAVSGGSVGRGAIYGTAIGGGLGAIYAGAKKGEDVTIPAGQPLNIVLDAPVTVTPGAGGYGGYGGQNYGGYNQTTDYNYSTPSYSQPQQNPYGGDPYYGQQQQPGANPYGGDYYGQ